MGTKVSGDKLKKLRNQMGWSQNDVADRVGVAASAISMYESNTREPARDTLLKIADVFKVPVDELLRDEIEPLNLRIDVRNRDDMELVLSVSRGRSNTQANSFNLLFVKNKPVLKVNGSIDDFGTLYANLLPEDKIAVCKAMLERAKDELVRGK